MACETLSIVEVRTCVMLQLLNGAGAQVLRAQGFRFKVQGIFLARTMNAPELTLLRLRITRAKC